MEQSIVAVVAEFKRAVRCEVERARISFLSELNDDNQTVDELNSFDKHERNIHKIGDSDNHRLGNESTQESHSNVSSQHQLHLEHPSSGVQNDGIQSGHSFTKDKRITAALLPSVSIARNVSLTPKQYSSTLPLVEGPPLLSSSAGTVLEAERRSDYFYHENCDNSTQKYFNNNSSNSIASYSTDKMLSIRDNLSRNVQHYLSPDIKNFQKSSSGGNRKNGNTEEETADITAVQHKRSTNRNISVSSKSSGDDKMIKATDDKDAGPKHNDATTNLVQPVPIRRSQSDIRDVIENKNSAVKGIKSLNESAQSNDVPLTEYIASCPVQDKKGNSSIVHSLSASAFEMGSAPNFHSIKKILRDKDDNFNNEDEHIVTAMREIPTNDDIASYVVETKSDEREVKWSSFSLISSSNELEKKKNAIDERLTSHQTNNFFPRYSTSYLLHPESSGLESNNTSEYVQGYFDINKTKLSASNPHNDFNSTLILSNSLSHRNYLLREMQWMAIDFHQERRWKIEAASRTVNSATTALRDVNNVIYSNVTEKKISGLPFGMNRSFNQHSKVNDNTNKIPGTFDYIPREIARSTANKISQLVQNHWKTQLSAIKTTFDKRNTTSIKSSIIDSIFQSTIKRLNSSNCFTGTNKDLQDESAWPKGESRENNANSSSKLTIPLYDSLYSHDDAANNGSVNAKDIEALIPQRFDKEEPNHGMIIEKRDDSDKIQEFLKRLLTRYTTDTMISEDDGVDLFKNYSNFLFDFQLRIVKRAIMLSRSGIGSIISGSRGSGRTISACSLAIQWLKRNFELILQRTNSKTYSPEIRPSTVLLLIRQESIGKWVDRIKHCLQKMSSTADPIVIHCWNPYSKLHDSGKKANLSANNNNNNNNSNMEQSITIVPLELATSFFDSCLYKEHTNSWEYSINLNLTRSSSAESSLMLSQCCGVIIDERQKEHFRIEKRNCPVEITDTLSRVVSVFNMNKCHTWGNRCLLSDYPIARFDIDYTAPALAFLLPEANCTIATWTQYFTANPGRDSEQKLYNHNKELQDSYIEDREDFGFVEKEKALLISNESRNILNAVFSSLAQNCNGSLNNSNVEVAIQVAQMGPQQKQKYLAVERLFYADQSGYSGAEPAHLARALTLLRSICFHEALVSIRYDGNEAIASSSSKLRTLLSPFRDIQEEAWISEACNESCKLAALNDKLATNQYLGKRLLVLVSSRIEQCMTHRFLQSKGFEHHCLSFRTMTKSLNIGQVPKGAFSSKCYCSDFMDESSLWSESQSVIAAFNSINNENVKESDTRPQILLACCQDFFQSSLIPSNIDTVLIISDVWCRIPGHPASNGCNEVIKELLNCRKMQRLDGASSSNLSVLRIVAADTLEEKIASKSSDSLNPTAKFDVSPFTISTLQASKEISHKADSRYDTFNSTNSINLLGAVPTLQKRSWDESCDVENSTIVERTSTRGKGYVFMTMSGHGVVSKERKLDSEVIPFKKCVIRNDSLHDCNAEPSDDPDVINWYSELAESIEAAELSFNHNLFNPTGRNHDEKLYYYASLELVRNQKGHNGGNSNPSKFKRVTPVNNQLHRIANATKNTTPISQMSENSFRNTTTRKNERDVGFIFESLEKTVKKLLIVSFSTCECCTNLSNYPQSSFRKVDKFPISYIMYNNTSLFFDACGEIEPTSHEIDTFDRPSILRRLNLATKYILENNALVYKPFPLIRSMQDLGIWRLSSGLVTTPHDSLSVERDQCPLNFRNFRHSLNFLQQNGIAIDKELFVHPLQTDVCITNNYIMNHGNDSTLAIDLIVKLRRTVSLNNSLRLKLRKPKPSSNRLKALRKPISGTENPVSVESNNASKIRGNDSPSKRRITENIPTDLKKRKVMDDSVENDLESSADSAWHPSEDDIIICMQNALPDPEFLHTENWLNKLRQTQQAQYSTLVRLKRSAADARNRYTQLCASGKTNARLRDRHIQNTIARLKSTKVSSSHTSRSAQQN